MIAIAEKEDKILKFLEKYTTGTSAKIVRGKLLFSSTYYMKNTMHM